MPTKQKDRKYSQSKPKKKNAQKKDRWKNKEADYWQMVEANTADDNDFSSYLANLDGGGVLICNPKKCKFWKKMTPWTHLENIFHLIIFTYLLSVLQYWSDQT